MAEQDEIIVPECLPVVPVEVPAPAPAGEEETSEDEDLAASELHVAKQNHKHWKCSYRLQLPEREKFAQQRRRLGAKARGLEGKLDFDSCRKRPHSVRLNIASRTLKQKNEKAKHIRNVFRQMKARRKD